MSLIGVTASDHTPRTYQQSTTVNIQARRLKRRLKT